MKSAASLWPGSEAVLKQRSESPSGRPFLLVPNEHSPRLLIPDNRHAASAATARFPAALSLGQAAGRALVSSMLKIGLRRPRSRHFVIQGGANGIDAFLTNILGQPVELSFGIGTSRINRKPVLGVFSQQGEPLAYAKVGQTPYTSTLIGQEAEALRELTQHEWSTFDHPKVIHTGVWNGATVLVMSYLPTSWRSAGNKRSAAQHIGEELNDRLGGGEAPLSRTPIWQRLRRSAGAALTNNARFLAAFETVEEELGQCSVTIGAWHGDLTPWNVAWDRRLLRIWDWERFEIGVPHGLDLLHWAVRAGADKSGLARSIVKSLSSIDVPITSKAVYLLAMAERFRAGGDLGTAQALVMLDALDLLRKTTT